ncbi:hypothetical protein QL285_093676 [Trifolium repens]|nr:hypothetical protein QL285_093676 [Trifolium repens]
MASLSTSGCIIDIEKSIPNKFAKDQRPYKFDELNFAMECPVDFESLRANGFPEVKTRFERQGMMYYFDMLNGPTYNEIFKEFWMKATVITKPKYQERLKELVKEKPELYGKTPAEMGLKPFISTEIESYVAGFRVAFRVDHIYEALKLSDGGLFIKSTDSVGPDVDEFIFKPKEELLKDSYECEIDASEFDEMYSKLPQRNDPHNLLAQQTLYGPADEYDKGHQSLLQERFGVS